MRIRGARGGLGQQHEPEGDVEGAEQDPPQEAAPSFGPEGVDDLERAGGDRGQADQLHADDGRERHVAESCDTGGDQDDAKQSADPQGWRAQSCDAGPAVIDCHATLLIYE